MQNRQRFSVCFSGHRPEKLPTGAEFRMMLSLLYSEVIKAVEDGADTFYTGCARGVDLAAAQIILYLKRNNPALKLICVQPYEQQSKGTDGPEQYLYQTVLQAADQVICLSDKYYRGCYRSRNQYMIHHSQRLIALVTDMQSGTGQTIRMAQSAGLDVRILSLEAAARQAQPSHEYFNF